MPKIITVSGSAQHGKDTFAIFAKEYFENKNKKCIIFHYADFLKFICKEYFGWNGEKDESGRTLLQYVGTDVFRKNKPDCWVNMAVEFISGIGNEFDYVIIPDARFENEIKCWSGKFNFSCIKVIRNNFDNGLTEEQKNHPSETSLNNFKFDEYILNDGSINDYKNKVFALLKFLNY